MFRSNRMTPHTKIAHSVIPGRPVALSVVGAISEASNSNNFARIA